MVWRQPKSFSQCLIDGDELAYRVAFASQHTFYRVLCGGKPTIDFKFPSHKLASNYFETDFELTYEPVIEYKSKRFAMIALDRMLESYFKIAGTDEHTIYFTGENNFRKEIATITPYKANRKPPPKYKDFLVGRMKSKYNYEVVDDAEADDGMSLNQTKNTIIFSQDKDLDMVPGWRYHPKKGLFHITNEEGWRSFYQQLLSGDDTDCIPGLTGIGSTRAKKHIDTCKTEVQAYRLALKLYTSEIFTQEPKITLKSKINGIDKTPEAVVLEIGRLLWMQRPQMKMWTPPTTRIRAH